MAGILKQMQYRFAVTFGTLSTYVLMECSIFGRTKYYSWRTTLSTFRVHWTCISQCMYYDVHGLHAVHVDEKLNHCSMTSSIMPGDKQCATKSGGGRSRLNSSAKLPHRLRHFPNFDPWNKEFMTKFRKKGLSYLTIKVLMYLPSLVLPQLSNCA